MLCGEKLQKIRKHGLLSLKPQHVAGESTLCLQCFICREHGEAVMISSAFSQLNLDTGSLMVIDCM